MADDLKLSPPSTPFWADKSLWLVILTPLAVLLSRRLGVEVPPELIYATGATIIGYVLSSKAKQAQVATKNADAQARVAEAAAYSEKKIEPRPSGEGVIVKPAE